jgi:hypothetical protein
LSIFVEGEYESVFIETCQGKTSTIIGEIYRVPDANAKLSLERYETTMNKLKSSDKRVLIGTDQNFDYLKIDTDKFASDLFDTCLAENFIPTITKPTRVTPTSATLIDNIYIRYLDPFIHSGIICSKISDHFPIFCFMGKYKPDTKPTKPLQFTYRPMPPAILNQIAGQVRETDWNYLNNYTTEESFVEFNSHLTNIINAFAPEKTVTIQPKCIIREEWMSKGLMKSSHTLNKLYRKCVGKQKTDESYLIYIAYRNCFNKLKQIAKVNYYSRLFNDFKNDSKNTWTILRRLISQTKDKTFVPTIFKHNNTEITKPQDIANHFCDFFSDVGPQYANKIPIAMNSALHYLNLERTSNTKSLFMNPTNPHEIQNILKSLKPKKSCGYDNINTFFLKQICNDIANPISILINKSLVDGIVPDSVKVAKVNPVYTDKLLFS